MRLILRFLFCVSLHFSAYGQAETVYFSEALKTHLKAYNIQSDIEFEKGDLVKGQFLFDSLVRNYLVGSKFTDFSLKSINSRKVKLSKIKKPVFIITYASWCVLNKGEVPALNKLSRTYSKDVKFIVLFWDKKENVKKLARKFNGNITVCYANESYRNDSRVVSTLKHALGFPTTYFLDGNLDVVDIKRGGVPSTAKTPAKDAFNQNLHLFNDRIAASLVKMTAEKEQLVTVE